MATEAVKVGSIIRKSKPGTFRFQFQDWDGTPLVITGMTIEVSIQQPGETRLDRTGAIEDGPTGWATYTFVDGDLAVADVADEPTVIQFAAFDGASHYLSPPLEVKVVDSPMSTRYDAP